LIRQDYIMRMIEQLVQVLAKILFNKEAKNYQEANNDIDAALNNILGLDYNLVYALSARDIISLLEISKDNTMLNIKCIAIAKLLKERAEIKNLNDKEDLSSIYDYQKALILFLEGILNNKNTDTDLSSYYSDIKEIVKNINDEISEDIRFKLFKFYELIGEFDKAEAELFMLRDLDYFNIQDEGIQFYRKLERLNDIDLIKGNLSKEKVTRGLKEFTRDVT
jgi:hypothetical protein